MIKPIKILVLLFIILSSSCNRNNLENLQEEVFNDVFNDLLKGIDSRRTPPPPPPPDENFVPKIDHDFFNDPRKFLITVNDSIGLPDISNDFKKEFTKPYQEPEKRDLVIAQIKRQPFNFEELPYDTLNIQVVYESIFKDNEKYFKKEFYFGARFYFSSITFNKDLNKGVFFLHYNCGKLCGQQSLFFVEKINGVWEVTDSSVISIS